VATGGGRRHLRREEDRERVKATSVRDKRNWKNSDERGLNFVTKGENMLVYVYVCVCEREQV
jgi:hypothetical protein